MNHKLILYEMQMTIYTLLFDHINEGVECMPLSSFKEKFDKAFLKGKQERNPELNIHVLVKVSNHSPAKHSLLIILMENDLNSMMKMLM